MTVEWKGDKYIEAVRRGNVKGLTAAAMAVQAQATELVPKITRNLSNSIAYQVREEDAIVGTNVEYAARIEYGFKGADSLGRRYNQSAQPYLEPSLHNNKKKIQQLLKEEIARAIREAGP